jgi:hypothetical protein
MVNPPPVVAMACPMSGPNVNVLSTWQRPFQVQSTGPLQLARLPSGEGTK